MALTIAPETTTTPYRTDAELQAIWDAARATATVTPERQEWSRQVWEMHEAFKAQGLTLTEYDVPPWPAS